jgi:predicted Rdx family selenoprotein
VLGCAQAYSGGEWDHVLPRSAYPRLRDTFANIALACRSCHYLKDRFDPGGEEKDSWGRRTDLTDVERELLIQRVRDFLKPKREKYDETIRSAQKLLRTPRTDSSATE